MPSDLSAYAAILVMAGVTLATRLLGAGLMRWTEPSKRLERFLDALSISVIAAIVVTVIARGGLREAVAVAIAGLVMTASKSAVWAMISGMAAAAAWTALAN